MEKKTGVSLETTINTGNYENVKIRLWEEADVQGQSASQTRTEIIVALKTELGNLIKEIREKTAR